MKKLSFIFSILIFMFSCQESLEQRAAREAREYTESKCPMPIGDNMILDSIVFDITTLTQSQYFRFIGVYDSDNINYSLHNAKEILVKELKGTPSYKKLLERGVNFHYVYRSTRYPEKIYLETTLTKEDYN